MKSNSDSFNKVGSSYVKQVDEVVVVHNKHQLSLTGNKNSVVKSYKDNRLVRERYYDEDGRAYLDIDYTNHGNAKTHPYVPHEHRITFIDGRLRRDRSLEGGIIK